MIIDSHVHIGIIGQFHMPESMVLESMEKYQIDYALVSNIEASEVDGDQIPIPEEQQISQLAANQKTINFARANPDKIGALLWVKPATEGCTPQFEALIADNRDLVYGLKVHPYLSNISFGSPEVEKYIQLAQKYDLVMVTHTSNDAASHPRVVYEVAQKFPDVNFVMVHMGLATDNQETIQLIAKLPNLHGDSTWVVPEKTMQAIENCGIDKILFGTDNPIDGPDTYGNSQFYKYYFFDMKGDLSTLEYEKFMYRNAIRLFQLDQFYKQ
jgi:predicted TIM-barrel fold metal-dependent hydrolase